MWRKNDVCASAKRPWATPDEVLRLVERFALLLTESGIPRMASRVFAYVLADDADGHTAGELAAGLRVSPGAISGAVRYLVQVGLLVKERETGARTDHYGLRSNLWYELYASRLDLIRQWEVAAAEGAELLGPDRAGGVRLRESQEFFAFARADLPEFMERWRRHREKVFGDDTGDGPAGSRRGRGTI
jgi:hypothetical protein